MAADSEGTGLASSLTDLMTSLAVIFILLLVASHNNEQQEIDTIKKDLTIKTQDTEDLQARLTRALHETDKTRKQILWSLQKELESFRAEGVQAKMDPSDPLGLLVIVPEELLRFAINEDKIPPGGVDFLRRFTPKLAKTVCSDSFREEISTIVIEGHTDSSGTPAINLPLSQRRSMTVVQESLNVLSKPSSDPGLPAMLLECYLHVLSASGRGSSELIRDAAGHEVPGSSRRVEFKIRVRSLEQRQEQDAWGIDPSPKAVKTP